MSDNINFELILRQRPQAVATVRGSKDYKNLTGYYSFYQTARGVIVSARVSGLPYSLGECKRNVFATHIHSGTSCTGTDTDPFADSKTHYNPHACFHPEHAGDMPPLFGCRGTALSVFLTDRFAVKDVIGRTVIIHSNPDDFTSQPSGNSGTKIACGIIRQNKL